jgi:FG-GAP repeat protein
MFRAGKRPWSAAVSDLNRDGEADLVIANNWSDTVSVLINDSGALAHDVTVVKDGSGSVTSDPAGIDCGADLQGP